MIPKTKALNWLLMLVGSILGSALPACNLDRVRITPKVPKELLLTSGRSLDPARSGVDLTLVQPEEVDLVEAVITHRELYRYRLRQLKDYYAARGYAAKESWAAFELAGLKKVQPFRYLLDGEVPQVDLEPKESVAEADALYQRGLELMRKGGHDIPIVYRQDSEVAARLRDAVSVYYSPRAAMYHYLSMARGNVREYLKGDVVWRKKYFYVLRPLLACRWIEKRGEVVVPMEFQVLLEATVKDPGLLRAVNELLAEKRAGAEQDRGPRIPEISDYCLAELDRLDQSKNDKRKPEAPDPERLNDLFREVLETLG